MRKYLNLNSATQKIIIASNKMSGFRHFEIAESELTRLQRDKFSSHDDYLGAHCRAILGNECNTKHVK